MLPFSFGYGKLFFSEKKRLASGGTQDNLSIRKLWERSKGLVNDVRKIDA